jgi:hypothetical protein
LAKRHAEREPQNSREAGAQDCSQFMGFHQPIGRCKVVGRSGLIGPSDLKPEATVKMAKLLIPLTLKLSYAQADMKWGYRKVAQTRVAGRVPGAPWRTAVAFDVHAQFAYSEKTWNARLWRWWRPRSS